MTASEKMDAPSSFLYALGQFGTQRFSPSSKIFFSPLPLPLLILLFYPTPFLSFQLLSSQSFIVSHSFASISVAFAFLISLQDSPHYANLANLDVAHNAGLCVFGSLDSRRRRAARKCSS